MNILRILHVDDEPDIREVVEVALGLDPDVQVRSCASGEEGLAVVEEWLPDIILLDVMMPFLDGPTTLARLREAPRTAGIPVIFMTARAQSRELERLRSLGAIGVIPKPFDPMTLAATVRAYASAPDPRLGEMRDQFLRRMDGDLASLARHWAALAKGTAVPDSLSGIRHIAHRLAGASGIFGLDDLSDAAATLEETVISHGGGSGTLDEIKSALDCVLVCGKADESRRDLSIAG